MTMPDMTNAQPHRKPLGLTAADCVQDRREARYQQIASERLAQARHDAVALAQRSGSLGARPDEAPPPAECCTDLGAEQRGYHTPPYTIGRRLLIAIGLCSASTMVMLVIAIVDGIRKVLP